MERKRNIQPATERRRAEAGAWRKVAAALAVEPKGRADTRHETSGAAASATAWLVDLSIHGCCIAFGEAADYRPGQFIRLGFAGDGDVVRAIVRWVEGPRIGAEFTRTLSSENIEAMLAQNRNPQVGLL